MRVEKTVDGVTTIYVGPHFEVETSGTQVISMSYYYALGRPVAMHTQDGGGDTVRYLHGDHLGSTSVVSGVRADSGGAAQAAAGRVAGRQNRGCKAEGSIGC